MRLATPVESTGHTGHAWGKAHWVAVAEVADGTISDWQVHEVAWDVSHDAGTHGSHHARVVTFLREQRIDAIVVDHVGEGMRQMLATMNIPMLPSTPGDAMESVLAAVRASID